jgi:DNA-binding SARP family transcriptional activator
MLRVRVLGSLELEVDGEQRPLPARRPARSLLGWLALHPGVHARSTVAGTLWPNVLEESARASLRTSLAALRAAIGPAADRALVASREQVGLAAEPEVWVDVREFERLVADGDEAGALELCRGELLPGLDDDWVLAARDALRARQGELLGALAEAAGARGDDEAAVAFARRRAALEPLDEDAQRDLIRRLSARGDRGGALAVYTRLADRLRRELGTVPSPVTRALAAELRGAGPASAPPPPPPPLPARLAAARRRGPLVGRDAPLAKLRALWTRSVRESRQLACVAGEPGIGKTRLVAELAAELQREGAVVLYGRAEEESLAPYQPLVECLREQLRLPLDLPVESEELAELLPEAAARLPGPAPSALGEGPAHGARLRLFEAVGATLDAIGAGRRLVLVLDDLHWADQPTLRLLVHLAARPAGPLRLVVAAYRDTDVDDDHVLAAALVDLRRELPVTRIELAGLDRDGVAALVEGSTGRTPEPADVRALLDRTAGNPFFVEELVGAGDASLPGSVTDAVLRRVAALGGAARPVLVAAAVAGPDFELALVAEVAGLSSEEVLDVLDGAVRARLVVELPDEPERYTFAHALVRDALTGPLSSARRARLHRLVASALEPRAADDPDRYLAPLAHHALEAATTTDDAERAAALAEQAARRARAVLAYEDAAELLRRAAAVLSRLGRDPARRAELLCGLAEAEGRAGAGEPARAAAREAGDLARSAGRADLVARAALAATGVGVTILRVDHELVDRLEEALGTVGPDGDPGLRVELSARLAIELGYDPDATRREHLSDAALVEARHLGEPARVATALGARHVALWAPDHTAERLRVATEMLELAEQAGDRELELQARNWRVVDLLEAGEGPAVRGELDAYAELAAEVRLPAFTWYVPLWRATLAFLEGRIAEGIELSRRALELGRRADDANAEVFVPQHRFMRMVIEEAFEDVDPATLGLDPAVVEHAQTGPAWRAFRLAFAWIRAERGELDQARRHLDEALGTGPRELPRDVNWLPAMGSASNACALLGDADLARELRTLLEPYSDRMVTVGRGSAQGGSVAYLLARLAAACGDLEDADRLFVEAEQRDERAGAPVWVLRDLRHHARLLEAAGQAERARTILARAAST